MMRVFNRSLMASINDVIFLLTFDLEAESGAKMSDNSRFFPSCSFWCKRNC